MIFEFQLRGSLWILKQYGRHDDFWLISKQGTIGNCGLSERRWIFYAFLLQQVCGWDNCHEHMSSPWSFLDDLDYIYDSEGVLEYVLTVAV